MAKQGLKRRLPIAVALAMVASVAVGAVVAAPASAAGVDHYVATTGADSGNCQTLATPCLTINYAVSQAGADDIINVAAGTYDENVVIDKSLEFRGANAGIAAGVAPGGRGPESIVKTFRTGTGATLLDLYGPTAHDITIDGFQVDTQGDAALEGATLQAGLIHLRGGTGTGTSVVNNIVQGASAFEPTCTFASCTAPDQMAPMGITVGSGVTDISDNTIQNFRYGARVNQQLGAGFPALTASFDSNVVTGVSVQGFLVGGVTGVQQPGATITNNEIDAIGRASDPAGILLSNAGNTVTGNTVEDMARGVTIVLCKKWDTRNNTVDDNVLIGAPLAIAVSTDGGQCATGSGGDAEGTGSWVVGGGRFDGFNANGNAITGGLFGFASSASAGFSPNKPVTAGPLDITCNWWGDASGPTNPGNPGGTGSVLAFSLSSGQPDYDYLPWEISDGGACTGGITGPIVSLGNQSGLERDLVNGSVFVPVTLSEAATSDVIISFYTQDGTATQNVDYQRWGTPAVPRTFRIPAGALQSTVNVPILTDAAVESDETFTLVLSGVSGGDAVIGDDTGIATIIDSDVLFGPNPVINVSNPSLYEGDDGQRRAQFQIQLSRAPSSPISLSYFTTDGTAIAGTDYVEKLPGSVQFIAGQISKTVDVLVNSDTTADSARDFFLDVLVTGGSPVEELNMSGVATILDDD